MPLLFLESFEVGTYCFTNTSLLVPVKFPNISRFCIGDNSFTNTRLAPITGSFMQVTVPDKDYANESAIRNKQNRIQQYMKKDALSAEEFTDNLENAFSLLKQIEIGRNCFFSTVVFVVHNIPQIESISIGEDSFHDVQSINLSYLPKLVYFAISPIHNISLYNLRLFQVPLLKGINYSTQQPMKALDFPCLSNFIYYNISPEMVALAHEPRQIDEEAKHPNGYFAPPNEYSGHLCREVSEMTTSYVNTQQNQYNATE